MPNARGTILVVEDEPPIRDLLRLHLGLAVRACHAERKSDGWILRVISSRCFCLNQDASTVVRSDVHDRRLRAT
jgi:hypothetical protein